MKLNNKGFAASIVLYSISTIIIVILMLILAIDASNVRNSSNMAEDIKEQVSGLGD